MLPARTLVLRMLVPVMLVAVTGASAASADRAGADPVSDRPSVAQLGFYPGYASVAGLTSLESWLGREAPYVVQFTASSDESAFTSSVWGQTVDDGALQTIAARTTFVESVPLTIGLDFGAGVDQRAAGLQDTLSGAHDDAYRQAAGYIAQAGFAGVILRLGWEFDGGWMPWSANGNEALWADAYRHVADVFRSALPGARFDWSGDPGWMQAETAAYPGDDYVDIIGLDLYDKGRQGAWDPSTRSWVDPAGAFDENLASLTFQRDFAIAHDKQVSYPEWALSSGGDEAPTSAGNDDPTFVQGLYDWMNSLPDHGPGSLAYHSYFNEDSPNDGLHALEHFPDAQERFRSLFGITPVTAQALPIRRVIIRAGYSMLSADGAVYAFGGARPAGRAPRGGVAIATRAGGAGYWIVDAMGTVSHSGRAGAYGNAPPLSPGERVDAIASTPSGGGYWLFTTRGRVFGFGDATFHGDLGAAHLNRPIVGAVASPTGRGYSMVAADGGVFAFGDAVFHGSTAKARLNRPIVGIASTPDGRGYWLVASDGGVFAFHAPFRGSMGGAHLGAAVTGLVAYGTGYLVVAADGGVFDFSDRPFAGSLGKHPPGRAVVGIAVGG